MRNKKKEYKNNWQQEDTGQPAPAGTYSSVCSMTKRVTRFFDSPLFHLTLNHWGILGFYTWNTWKVPHHGTFQTSRTSRLESVGDLLVPLSKEKPFQNRDVLEISPIWCHKVHGPLSSRILINLKSAKRKHLNEHLLFADVEKDRPGITIEVNMLVVFRFFV